MVRVLTASQIARSLHGVKAGKRWMCRCPVSRMHQHGDRNRSLSVWESEDGWVCLKCFAGCTRDEILAAMGLKVRDLALRAFNSNPEWEQRRKDSDRLEKVEHLRGLAILAQILWPDKRNYWRAVEQNSFEEAYWLSCKLYPKEYALYCRDHEVQRIIAEYGFDELWECLP